MALGPDFDIKFHFIQRIHFPLIHVFIYSSNSNDNESSLSFNIMNGLIFNTGKRKGECRIVLPRKISYQGQAMWKFQGVLLTFSLKSVCSLRHCCISESDAKKVTSASSLDKLPFKSLLFILAP